ncbi:Por secretion system C-terminal sorting domain-containing protein [Chryseobacterium oleae]|uniref:Por secretion system C-terminal sorting domain-containing protein n=1 Tax=Chryseobacterium oleae TaxID=491207 RepID=A0A1I4ZHQ5_CHROL|nr:GEVED domain-containing protein [Chryseobacterium oleae]SFN49430.1 Por secretion system C-terminal sorting domain-containing protein [Chryseobacterium oleae]
MKKTLLLSFMALATMGSAQILVTESFENATYPGFVVSGGYTGTQGTYISGACDGTVAIGAESYGSSDTNRTVNLIYTKPASITANGKKIDISFTYSTSAYDALSSIGGTVNVGYSTDGGTTYLPVGSPVTLTSAAQTCAAFSGTIPESANVNGNFMLRIQTVGTSGTSYDFYNFIDNVKIKQEVTALPACTTISSPVSGATGVSVRPQISWAATAGAEFYKIKVGTTTGASNVYTGITTGTSFTPPSTEVFPQNTLLYVSITPTNAIGDATGCPEISFTTAANPYAPYCGSLVSKLGVYPISNVVLANMTNASSATANTGDGHENFTSKIATVTRGTSHPITLTGTGVGTNRFGFTVFIDWNQNGSFGDAGEAYFVTSDFAGSTGNTVTVNKNIAVPATAALGNTRMRVKYQFNSSTTSVRAELSSPCSDLSQGQAEDYTITVQKNVLGTSEVNAENKAISLYPNPFKDIVNISDIKDVKSIVVTDVAGRQVKTMKSSTEINLSDLSAGLYLVSLHMEDGTVRTLKAIKK